MKFLARLLWVPCVALALALSFPAGSAADAGDKDDPLAGDPILDGMIRKQKQQETKRKDPKLVKVKGQGVGALAEDDEPLSGAPDAKLKSILEQMENVRTKIKSLECGLTKRKQVPLFEIDDEFRGKLKFRTPRLLRMELKGPVPKKGKPKTAQQTTITIVNEEYAYIWRYEEKEAERFKLPPMKAKKFHERNPLEYGLAADIRNLQRDYFLNLRGEETIVGRRAHKIVAGPKPHLKAPKYKRLYFWIDMKSWLPIRYRQVKSDGEVVETYTLTKIERNPTWFSNPFKRPPRSVHIIEHDLAEPKR